VKLRDAAPSSETPQAEPAAVTDADEALDPPMPDSSAPPSMRPSNVPAGIPARSARFRRGSRGPRVAPPEIPNIGMVEVDPNFKPRIELVPPKVPPPRLCRSRSAVTAHRPAVPSAVRAVGVDVGDAAGVVAGRGRGGGRTSVPS